MATASHIGRQSRPNLRALTSFSELSKDARLWGKGHFTRESDNRQGRLLFKMAVELTILQNIIAANSNIDVATLERVRGICVNEVKKLNGIISFDEAVRWQS